MIVFHHIPKSAGTTISTAIIEANEKPSLSVGSEGLSAHDTSNLADLAFLCGHIPYQDIVPLLTEHDTGHFSILRHPLERLISYFEMAYRDNAFFQTEVCFKDKWSHGFDVFYDRFVEAASLNNLMCSYFHPSRRFYDAAHVITDKFDFVGSMDALGQANRFLEHYLPSKGLQAAKSFPKLNVSNKGEPFWRSMSGTTLNRIRDSNHEDFLLFDWLTEKHGGSFVRDRLS